MTGVFVPRSLVPRLVPENLKCIVKRCRLFEPERLENNDLRLKHDLFNFFKKMAQERF